MGEKKSAWEEEFAFILRVCRTTARNATGQKPFALTYGVDSMAQIETEILNFQIDTFDEEVKNNEMKIKLNLIDKKTTGALTQLASQNEKWRGTTQKSSCKSFIMGSLVLRRRF